MQLPSADSDLLIRRPCAAHEWTGRAARAGHALCDSTTVRGRCLVSTRPRRAHHRAAFRATHRERTPVRPGALGRRAHAPARLPCRTPQQYRLCTPPPLAQKSRPPLVRATSRRRTSPSLVADSLRSARSLSQLVARSMPARSTCRERQRWQRRYVRTEYLCCTSCGRPIRSDRADETRSRRGSRSRPAVRRWALRAGRKGRAGRGGRAGQYEHERALVCRSVPDGLSQDQPEDQVRSRALRRPPKPTQSSSVGAIGRRTAEPSQAPAEAEPSRGRAELSRGRGRAKLRLSRA